MIGKPFTGWSAVIALGVTGFFIAGIGSVAISKGGLSLETKITTYPAAYELPKIPGATSFRLAMLHDVLLDRYLHHGDAWYTARNNTAKVIIDKTAAANLDPTERLALYDAMDDLAVGLENLHQSDAAANIMRQKLALLPQITIKHPKKPATGDYQDELANAYFASPKSAPFPPNCATNTQPAPNLGTSLIHGSIAKALAGDPKLAADQLREGLQFIQDSIAINPRAHFGREKLAGRRRTIFPRGNERPLPCSHGTT